VCSLYCGYMASLERTSEEQVEIQVEVSETEFTGSTQSEDVAVGSPDIIESSQPTIDACEYVEREVTPNLEPLLERFYVPLVNVWRHYQNRVVGGWIELYRSAAQLGIQCLVRRSGITMEFVYDKPEENFAVLLEVR